MEAANLTEGIDLLRTGAVDALAGNAWTIRYLLVQRRITGVNELPPFARRSGNIAVREGETALLAEIDRALSLLKASGEFDAILDRWSGNGAYLVPDWVVHAAIAGGTTAALALAGVGWQAMRLLREVPRAQAPQRSTPARPFAMATAALRRRRTRCRQG